MHGLICDVFGYCARSCDMGKISIDQMIKSWLKTRERMRIRELYTWISTEVGQVLDFVKNPHRGSMVKTATNQNGEKASLGGKMF